MAAHTQHVSPETFRDAIGHFAGGVTVITAALHRDRLRAVGGAI